MPSNEYWAGFFDGEGSVSINSGGRVQVSITQKGRKILELAQQDFGGHIYCKSKKILSPISNWKVCSKVESLNFLNAIYPYSIVKKKEIELGLKAIELIRSNNLGCEPLMPFEQEERMQVRQEMQDLRPQKTFRNLRSEEYLWREEIKKQSNFRCSSCNQDLKDVSPVYQVIRDDKLICRKCNALRNIKEIKPLTKEQIESAIGTTENLEEASKKLGLVRSSLYKKRKKLGLPQLEGHRGGYNRHPYHDAIQGLKKKESDKQYYLKHRDRLIKKQQEYYESHKDEVLEYHRKFYNQGKSKPDEG